MDAASIRTSTSSGPGVGTGHLVERRGPGADSRLRIARIVSTRAILPRANGAPAGDTIARMQEPSAQPPTEQELDGALRQPARAAPAAGQRRRCDLRLPRRARRPRARASARCCGSSRARRRSSGPLASRPITGAWSSRSRACAGTAFAEQAPARGSLPAPRPDQLPRRARRPLRRRLARQERRRAAAQPLLAPRDRGRGGLAGAHLLRTARTDAQALVEITKSREIGVPTFVIGGLLIPAGSRSGGSRAGRFAMVDRPPGRRDRSRDRPRDLVVRPPRRGAREPAHPPLRHAAARRALADDRELRRSRPRISRIASPS